MCFHDYSLLANIFPQKLFVDEKLAGTFSELSASSIMVCPNVFSASDVAEAMLWRSLDASLALRAKQCFLADGKLQLLVFVRVVRTDINQ